MNREEAYREAKLLEAFVDEIFQEDLAAIAEFIRTDGWQTTDLNPPPLKTYVLAYSERIGTCIAARFPDCKWADSSGLDVSPCPYWKELESPPYL